MKANKLHFEFAQLASATYQKRILDFVPKKWQLIKESPCAIDGYKGYAFTNGKINVLVHRGTDEIADSLSNLQLYLREMPLQLISASMFTLSVGKIHTHIGHSLGGTIAQLMAAYTKSEAVSFDSPGIGQIVSKTPPTSSYNFDHSIEYLAAPNFINTQDVHLGKLYKVYIAPQNQEGFTVADFVKYSLQQHSITNIMHALASEPLESVSTWPKGFAKGYRSFIDSTSPTTISPFEEALNLLMSGIIEDASTTLDKLVHKFKASEHYASYVTPIADSVTTIFEMNALIINSSNQIKETCTHFKDYEQKVICEELAMLAENVFDVFYVYDDVAK